MADRLLTSRFTNTAQRSWYWGSNLASLSASVSSRTAIEGRIFCSYPNFLRHNSAWVKRSVVKRLAETCGCSYKAVREELLPSLIAIQGKDGKDFSLSLALSLSPEEHIALCGMKSNLKSTKSLMEKYAKEMESQVLMDLVEIPVETENTVVEVEEEVVDTGQKTLF